MKVEQYFRCLTRSFHPRGASWRNRSVPNIAGAKLSGNQELHICHYFHGLVCDLNIWKVGWSSVLWPTETEMEISRKLNMSMLWLSTPTRKWNLTQAKKWDARNQSTFEFAVSRRLNNGGSVKMFLCLLKAVSWGRWIEGGSVKMCLEIQSCHADKQPPFKSFPHSNMRWILFI